jgi:glyoxylate reductase
MAKPAVFVSRRVAQEALNMLESEAEVMVWEEYLPPSRDEMLVQARRCVGLVTMLTDRIDAELLDQAPYLKAVCNVAVGFDNIDVGEATKHGVLVSNTPSVLTKTTADFAFALLMAAARRVAEGERFIHEGRWTTWHPGELLGKDVYGATLGLVGLGQIGLEVAKRAMGFDMQVVYNDVARRVEDEEKYGLNWAPDLESVLRVADYISLHVPLTPETRHLIGARELHLMKRDAILINTSRGPVVDQNALYNALKEGTIRGAALDVTEQEPIPQDEQILTLPNALITPHIASASVNTRTRMATLAVENLLAAFQGKPGPTCLNPEALLGNR